MDEPAPPELLIYCNCMERVKHHIRIIENAFSGTILVANQPDYFMLLAELIFLHFGKALEEIAFASLSANGEKYAAARAGFATEWNARRMLGFIEKVNPHFYPLPLQEPKETARGMKQFEPTNEPFLTREDFEKLYDSAGELLYSPNPFAPKKDAINVHYTVEEWVTRIGRLLSWHVMQIPGLGGVWLIRVPSDTCAHAFLTADVGLL
jgi:hypothetical protein